MHDAAVESMVSGGAAVGGAPLNVETDWRSVQQAESEFAKKKKKSKRKKATLFGGIAHDLAV